MIVRYAAAVIAATWLLWQLPFRHTESVTLPEVFAATQLAGMLAAAPLAWWLGRRLRAAYLHQRTLTDSGAKLAMKRNTSPKTTK